MKAWGALFLHKPAAHDELDDVPWADKAKQSLIEQDIRQRIEKLQRDYGHLIMPQVELTPWWALPGKAWLSFRRGGPGSLWSEVRIYFHWLRARRR